MRTPRFLLLLLLSITGLRAAPVPLIPLDTLFAEADMASVAISPTGRYLTWLAPKNQRINLAIMDRDGIYHATIDIEPGTAFA